MKITILIPFLLFQIIAKAQEVTNIKVHQEGDKIIITYDLQQPKNKKGEFDVKAFYTTDGGEKYSPLKSTTGDIGANIKPGGNKKITWNVLSDLDGIRGDIQFKIEADYHILKIEDHLILKYNTPSSLSLSRGSVGDFSLNYGWFKGSNNKNGKIISFNIGFYFHLYDYSNIGINFGLMHKLVNNPKFQLIFYEQIGLYLVPMRFDNQFYLNGGTFDKDYTYYYNDFEIIENDEYACSSCTDKLSIDYKKTYLTLPFPIESGLIFDINRFNILTGIKIYNNKRKKIKELSGYLKNKYNVDLDYPPVFSLGISLGFGYTF